MTSSEFHLIFQAKKLLNTNDVIPKHHFIHRCFQSSPTHLSIFKGLQLKLAEERK